MIFISLYDINGRHSYSFPISSVYVEFFLNVWPKTILSILFRPIGFLALRDLYIIRLSNVLTLSVSGDCYFRTTLYALRLISTSFSKMPSFTKMPYLNSSNGWLIIGNYNVVFVIWKSIVAVLIWLKWGFFYKYSVYLYLFLGFHQDK